MKYIFLIAASLLGAVCNAQITTTKIAENTSEEAINPYDSTANFLGKDVNGYIGQELYLIGKSEGTREYGYEGFIIDPNVDSDDKSNIYKCCDGFNSKYADLAGKYFKVLNTQPFPEDSYYNGRKYYFELQEKESGDKVFYEYDVMYEHSFPFLVVGYFIKKREDVIGREFITRGRNWISDAPMADMNTGLPVSFEAGTKWKCVDLTIEEKYYSLSLVLENAKGEKIPLSIDRLNSTYYVIDAERANKVISKYGHEKWNKILEGKVVVGFTEEMVLLSWGKPDRINESSYNDQWVYDGQYLYFKNGLLKSFN